MAHQLGYASESEANFIGYLASIRNDRSCIFKYSGYSYALRYCLHNWKIRDKKILNQLLPLPYIPVYLKNYDENEKFWDQYETFIETGFEIFYDNFLKFNQQKDGLESYSKFVDLMVNYYKENTVCEKLHLKFSIVCKYVYKGNLVILLFCRIIISSAYPIHRKKLHYLSTPIKKGMAIIDATENTTVK
jgi:hypothetical protein